jgi:alanyl-tRNA synthetase
MTHRLYYDDPACRAFDAVVTGAFEHEGRPAVTLDRTAFYPASGGQPFDTGRLGDTEVVETIDGGDEVIHIVDAPLAVGTRVHGALDWVRRFDHMQQHTGQHVLSAAFVHLFGNETLSIHIGPDYSTIDLAREMSPTDRQRAVEAANAIVWDDREVSIRWVPAEEAVQLGLRKEPARRGALRLVEIEEFDRSACGGTHVARTGSIGLVAVIGAERLRGGVRLTFVCGGRALRALQKYHDAVAGSVRLVSVLPEELPLAVQRIQAESRELKRTVSRMQRDLVAHEAARLLSHAPVVGGVRVIAEVLENWDPPELKAIASALCSQHAVRVALFSASLSAGRDGSAGFSGAVSQGRSINVVVARSAEAAIDANVVLRRLTETFGGRGGGRPDLAQGGGLAGEPAIIVSAARRWLGLEV